MTDGITADVLVVGAGLAGLTAARRLRDGGITVVVLDKGRAYGGRTASRGFARARHDQGAQFVTLRDDRVADLTSELRDAGALVHWFDGGPDVTRDQLPWRAGVDHARDDGDGHPRYRGAPSSRGPAEHLARSLTDGDPDGGDARPRAATVRLAHRVAALSVRGGRWVGEPADDDPVATAGMLVLTAPAPQAATLLAAGGATADADVADALAAVRYEPCWTLLAEPGSRPRLPPSGAARLDDEVVAFIADEQRKGVSDAGAVTVHSTGAWATAHLEDDADDVGRALAAAAGPLVGAALAVRHVHRWRYATPVAGAREDAPVGTARGEDGTSAPLVLAGDAYVGGRVEGAIVSGHLAAEALRRDI